MPNRDDYPDAEEPDAVSEEYLARLADYRRRLNLLRDNLFRLNDLVERAHVRPGHSSRVLH